MNGGAIRHVAVIDIGKTNAKLALVDLATAEELSVITRPNTPLPGPPYRHFDTGGHWTFMADGLADMQRAFGIDGISVTTHGASVVLLDAAGDLATPILDYEDPGPDTVADAYDALRPDFAETGSPRLPGGLNVGAQLHWLLHRDPELGPRVATVMTYPQYWSFRLSGVRTSDVTSLGCHTDLWCPGAGGFSTLSARLGLAGKMAPPRRPDTVLGPVLPGIAARCGLRAETPVSCGIHDSNASLYPHLLGRAAPFSVLSTGTWVIAMAVGGDPVTLDPAEDTLMNVNALGAPTPSARFMGGRTFEDLTEGQAPDPDHAVIAAVAENGVMILPDPAAAGAFASRPPVWRGPVPAQGSAQRTAAVSFFLALVSATCLARIGALGPVIVEGAFARNRAFLSMLATATGRQVSATGSVTGTSLGAALLFASETPVKETTHRYDPDSALRPYAAAWRAAAGA